MDDNIGHQHGTNPEYLYVYVYIMNIKLGVCT